MAIDQGVESNLARAMEVGRQFDPAGVELIVNQLAAISLQSLTALDTVLCQAEEPLPTVSISLSYARDGARLPSVWVGYGQTEPGKGLRPTERIQPCPEDVVKRAAGFAVPLISESRGAATFHPSPPHVAGSNGTETPPSWWQQWSAITRTDYIAGQEPSRKIIDVRADALGDDHIATWLSDEAPFNAPPVIFDSAVHPERVTVPSVVTILQGRPHLLAVGARAVSGTLRGISASVDQAPVFEPLENMLDVVSDALALEY